MKRGTLTANSDFMKLWAGQTVSAFGTMFGALGLTALLYLHATPGQMGLLAASEGVPVLLFALFAGVWVDRLRRRPIMIASDLGRFLLLASVPVAAALDSLRLELVYGVAFGTALLALAFNLSYRSYLPSVVEGDEILEANSKLAASESVAEVGSPAVGGGIVQTFGGPAAVFVDALTFLVSAISVGLIRKPEPQIRNSTAGSVLGEVAQGLSLAWRDGVLRTLAVAAGIFRFSGGFFAALYAVFLIRELGLSPLAMGVTIGAGGIGSFAGAMVTAAITRRLGTGRAVVGVRVAFSLVSLPLVLAGGPKELAFAMIFFAQLFGDPFWAAYEITTLTVRQSITPPEMLGRVNSTMHLVEAGLQPVGALVAGLLAEAIGVREALFVSLGLSAIGVAYLAFSPVARLGELPAPNAKTVA
jgi:predicted MFS family arabinose efflux permease